MSPFGRTSAIWGATGLVFLALAGISLSDRLSGLIIAIIVLTCALGLIFITACAVARRSGFGVDFGVLIALQMFLGFGVGALYFAIVPTQDARLLLSPSSLVLASVLGLLGCLSVLFGYWASANAVRISVGALPGQIAKQFDGHTVFTVVCLFGIGWLSRLVQLAEGGYFHEQEAVDSSSGSVVISGLSLLPSLAFFLLVNKRWRQGRPLGVVWCLLIVEIGWYLPAGARSPLVALGIGLIVMRIRLGQRVPVWSIIGSVVLASVLVFPLVSAYRGTDSSYSRSINDSATSAVASTFSGGPAEIVQSGVESTLSRFSDFQSAGKVFEESATTVRQVGSSFSQYVLTAPLPRALAPSKPDPGKYGNEFGRSYGLIELDDTATSISVSQPLFSYLQTGWLGVVCLGLLYGVGYRYVQVLLFEAKGPVSEALFALVAFSVSASTGTIWPLGFLGLIKQLGLLIGVVLFCQFAGQVLGWRDTGVSMPSRSPEVVS